MCNLYCDVIMEVEGLSVLHLIVTTSYESCIDERVSPVSRLSN